ncbi:MAG: hypothetical protein IPJ65_11895 [Archangiaceae bacterium]|nr:hypothetical protein [Archangiaceae bacterium]
MLLAFLASCATPPPPPPPPARDLREELRRHGEWILVSPYGKLWHPNASEVGQGFVPYLSGGQWQLTPRGWSFEAKWPWSDVVFHHGRWLWTQDYDWLWSFDELHGLAFVDWRQGSEWVGWSPQPPIAPRAGAPAPERRWFYVKARHLAQDELVKYVLGGDEHVKAMQHSDDLAAGPFSGPGVDFVTTQGGLVGEADGGYRVPELAAPAPEPVVQPEAPRSNVEVEPAEKPARPEKPAPRKTRKKGKK